MVMMVVMMMVVAAMVPAKTPAAIESGSPGSGDRHARAIDHLPRCGWEQGGCKGGRDNGGQDLFVHALVCWL
jgi:hypothetical protein